MPYDPLLSQDLLSDDRGDAEPLLARKQRLEFDEIIKSEIRRHHAIQRALEAADYADDRRQVAKESYRITFLNLLSLKRLQNAMGYVRNGEDDKEDPVKGAYRVGKHTNRIIKQTGRISSASTDSASDHSSYSYNLLDYFRRLGHMFSTPLYGIDKPGIGLDTTKFAFLETSNGLKGFGSILRMREYVRGENKNVNYTIDFLINFSACLAALVAAIIGGLAVAGLIGSMPLSALALAAYASITSIVRGVLGMGRGLFRLIRTENMDTAQDSAKLLMSSTLKVGLYLFFAFIMTLGPPGMIAGTVLMILLFLPQLYAAAKATPKLREWVASIVEWGERQIAKVPRLNKWLLTPCSRFVTGLLFAVDIALTFVARGLVFCKTFFERKRRVKAYAREDAFYTEPGIGAQTQLQFSSESIPDSNWRQDLDYRDQRDLNQMLRNGARSYLIDDINKRLNRLPARERADVKDCIQAVLRYHEALKNRQEHENEPLPKPPKINPNTNEKKKIVALFILSLDFERDANDNVVNYPNLLRFHEIKLRSGIYKKGSFKHGKDLSGIHISIFKHVADFTKVLDNIFETYLETVDARTFGRDLLQVISNKMSVLSEDKYIENGKIEALLKLHESIARAIAGENADPKAVSDAIKYIENHMFSATFSFINKCETKEIIKYAKTFVAKLRYEQANEIAKQAARDEARGIAVGEQEPLGDEPEADLGRHDGPQADSAHHYYPDVDEESDDSPAATPPPLPKEVPEHKQSAIDDDADADADVDAEPVAPTATKTLILNLSRSVPDSGFLAKSAREELPRRPSLIPRERPILPSAPRIA